MAGLVTLLLRTLQPPLHRNATGLGCSDFARHYFRNRDFFLFLQVLRWFTSLGSLVLTYVFGEPYGGFAAVGFPIRRSPDITPVCGSPELIAADHVLHRLFLPRHPPCALSSLTIKLTSHSIFAAALVSVIRLVTIRAIETAYRHMSRFISKDTQLCWHSSSKAKVPLSLVVTTTQSILLSNIFDAL
jgi:hypothetical protein